MTNAHRRLAILGMLVMPFAPVSLSAPRHAPADRISTDWSRPLSPCGLCGNCSSGGFTAHTFGAIYNAPYEGYPHGCTPSLWGCPHPYCWIITMTSWSAGEILVAAGKGDVDAAVALISAQWNRAEFNRARQALQLMSECDPRVVGFHIPLNLVQVAAVERALAESSVAGGR